MSLDLLVALAPCVAGYGEIGSRLQAAGCARPDNRYATLEHEAGVGDVRRILRRRGHGGLVEAPLATVGQMQP
ncbi:MAG: hypothetical protein AAFX81_21675, partial [Pseudomonadota bacterium]